MGRDISAGHIFNRNYFYEKDLFLNLVANLFPPKLQSFSL